jgi:hypothetical protein
VQVAADGLLAARVPLSGDLLGELRGVGDALGPAPVQVRFERVEEVAAADRLAQQLVNRGGAGETPDGLAVQRADPADRR